MTTSPSAPPVRLLCPHGRRDGAEHPTVPYNHQNTPASRLEPRFYVRQKTRAEVAAGRPSGGAGGAAVTPTARSSSSAAQTSKPTAMLQVSVASGRLQVESARAHFCMRSSPDKPANTSCLGNHHRGGQWSPQCYRASEE